MSKFQRHSCNTSVLLRSRTWKKGGKNKILEFLKYKTLDRWIFVFPDFPPPQDTLIKRYSSSSPISAPVDPSGCRCPVYLDFGNSLVPLRFDAFCRRNRGIGSTFVNCHGGEVGEQRVHVVDVGRGLPRAHRVQLCRSFPVRRYSGAKCRTRAPRKKNCGTTRKFTVLECPRKSLNGCSVIAIPRSDRVR